MDFEDLTPEASPIPLLEAITNLISAEEEEDGWDLLRDDLKRRATHSTVGIRLAQNSSATDLRPLQIQLVIPGSSAHICGLLNRTDEIIAVDGQQALASDIVRQVRGSDIVGSKVVLTVRKGGVGQVFDVALVRGAWGAVERKEKLFILFEELQKLIKSGTKKMHLYLFGISISITHTDLFNGTSLELDTDFSKYGKAFFHPKVGERRQQATRGNMDCLSMQDEKFAIICKNLRHT